MVYLESKKVKGYTYWYAIEKKRINGEFKKVWQMYLGSAEKIVERMSKEKEIPAAKLKSFEYGKIAALFDVNQDLGFVENVDRHVKMERLHGLTPGEYMLLIVMGRCGQPISKNRMEKWFKNSCIRLLWKFKHKLNSQNFYNHMKRVDKKREEIETDIAGVLIDKGLIPSSLILDTTNFFTYIENFDNKQKLIKKGKSKHHRNDKNLVAFGLVVSEENIPFLHSVYEANIHDSKVFPVIFDKIVKRLTTLHINTEKLTLVFDKGNNSEPNISNVMGSMHVVGSIPPSQAKEQMKIPLYKYTYLYTTEKGHEIIGYRTRLTLFGYKFTVVITYNEHTYNRQIRTYNKNKGKIFTNLEDLNKRLQSKQSKRDLSSVEREVNDIIRKDMRSVIEYKIEKRNGKFVVIYSIPPEDEDERIRRFGKNVIFTDMDHWSSKKIAKTYNSKYIVEDDFKWFNDDALVPLTPLFARLDGSVRMHIFLCIVGMLFYRYLFWKLRKFKLSGQKIVEELTEIRIAIVKQKESKKAKIVFEEMTPLQARLLSFLDLGRFINS